MTNDIARNLDVLISIMYAKILDRAVDEDGYRAIVNTVRGEDTLFRVVTNLLGSGEVRKRHLPTTAVAEFYAGFAKAHPDDLAIQRALIRVLRHCSGKRYLEQVESFGGDPVPTPYLGSIWLSEKGERIGGWLVVEGGADRLSVEVRVQDGEPQRAVLRVGGEIAFVDIPLEEALPDNCYMLFDARNSAILIEKNIVFRDRLFCDEYVEGVAGGTADGAEGDPFEHFMGEGLHRGMKFNPFTVPGLGELRDLDAQDLLEIGTFDEAGFLTGLVDPGYCARRAGIAEEESVQHASACVLRDEWVDFHPLLVRKDFRRHGFATMLEWLDRLTDPATSVADLDFDRFSPAHYRRTCDAMVYENELIDYLFNGEKVTGEPHPFCDTRYAMRHLPEDFAWPRRGLWADSFCEPERYRIPFSPFWDPSALEYEIPPPKGTRPDPTVAPLDTYLDRLEALAPSPLLVPSALVHRFLEWPLEECRADRITGRDVVAALTRALACTAKAVDEPKLSVLILDYGKPGLSIVAAIAAAAGTRRDVEVIVLDNGSMPEDFFTIAEYTRDMGNVRTVRSDRNLYFGEGNNVLIDLSAGELILFLNNDAFVGPTMIDEMIAHLDAMPGASAVGPTFLYPDLRIQEAGGTISDCGREVQLHKGASLDRHLAFAPDGPVTGVQYVSAACCCIRRSVFEEIGGFDYIYEPFYFEDIDLCKRMEMLGHRLDHLPRSFVIHYENASTRSFLSEGFVHHLERSRRIFRERWLYSRPDFRPRTVPSELNAEFDPAREKAVVHAPAGLSPGDEERYLLCCAVALSERYDVLFCADARVSATRLAFLIEDLRIETPGKGAIRPCLYEEVPDWNDVAVTIMASEEIVPPLPMRARVNIVHCRHPRPAHRSHRSETARLDAVDAYFVDSDFIEEKVRADQRRFGCMIPIVTTGVSVAAPVDPADRPVHHRPLHRGRGGAEPEDAILRVLSTGPFAPPRSAGDHATSIAILDAVHAANPDTALSLMGPIDGTERCTIHVGRLEREAGTLPVAFHFDPSRRVAEEELDRADVYLDTGGCSTDMRGMPERMEPYVNDLLRAMAAGCVPVVYEKGAPAEIVRRWGAGYLYGSATGAADALQAFRALDAQARAEMVDRVRAAAARYSDAAFRRDILARVGELVDSAT